jgi:uncharacterized membrane protein YdjX (TVP38/TMEM64 family)
VRRGPFLLLAFLTVLIVGATFSYLTTGFVYVLVTGTPDQGPWLERVRDAVSGWGRLAPLVYTLVVVVEVVVAPIPGALLYAPGGAVFGGFVGGTLSLAGNVVGAGIACAIGGLAGERMLARHGADSQLARYRERLRDRGLWIVLILRANPLTSSDLVSYAAGIAGVPPWKVAIGTLGMAPLCYIQAYFAEQVFTLIPGWVLLISGVLFVVVLLLTLSFGYRKPVERAEQAQRHSV